MKTSHIKNILSALILIACFNHTAFAYINNQPESGLTIYCPPKIECTGEPTSLSCTTSGSYSQYWDANVSGSLRKGTYLFYKTFAQFVMPRRNDVNSPSKTLLTCEYKYADSYPFPVDNIRVKPKDGAHFQPIVDKHPQNDTTKFSMWEYWVDGLQSCNSTDPMLCPFRESASLQIAKYLADPNGNHIKQLNLEISANGITLNAKQSSDYIAINYNDALQVCGSVKQCTFYIRQSQYMGDDFWTVTLDLTNNLAIENITSPNSLPYAMIKNPLFNSIDWKNTTP